MTVVEVASGKVTDTKLQIGADLAIASRAAGFVFRAVAADSAYGDQDGLRGELAEAGLP